MSTEQTLALPSHAPVMPLPGAGLFPHALLPLYIFEPRYQQMLAHALAHDRMFCVALVKSQNGDWHSTADFFQTATIGLVRACVGRGDGTSNLILQGLRRVRFIEFEQRAPFPIAHIEALDAIATPIVQSEALGTKVLELYQRLKGHGRELPEKVDRFLSDLSDPAMLADLMAATFVSDSLRRQRVLEALAVNERLRLLIQYLSEETGGAVA